MKFVEKYWVYFALAIAGLGVGRALLGGLGRLLAGRGGLLGRLGGLLGGGGRAAAAGATQAAGAAGGGLAARAGLLGRGAAAATGRAAGVLGRVGMVGRMGLGGTAAGVAAAGYIGWETGKWLDKTVGPILVKNMSKETQRFIGKDKTISGVIGHTFALSMDKAFGGGVLNRMVKEMTRVRGVVTPKMRKGLKKLEKAIGDSYSVWNQLTDKQKKQVKLMEQQRDAIKRRIELDKKSAKIDVARTTEIQREQVGRKIREVTKPFEAKIAKGQLTKADIKRMAQEFGFGKMRGLLRKGGEDLAEAFIRGRGAGEDPLTQLQYAGTQQLRAALKQQGLMKDFIKEMRTTIQKRRITMALRERGLTPEMQKVIQRMSPEQTAAVMMRFRERGKKTEIGGMLALPEEMKAAIKEGGAGELKLTFDPGTGQPITSSLSQAANGDITLTMPGQSQKVIVKGKQMDNMLRNARKK
jgi:hypothetical protein